MRAKVLKKDNRYDLFNDTGLGIQRYGEYNDYPQDVMEIVDASGTGKSCVNVYAKFISGKGFLDNGFYKKIINRKGQTNDYLVNQISDDFARLGGFAIHVNYNALFQIIELQHIPLEQIRFEKLDDNGEFSRVAIHPDWGKRNTNLRRWRRDDIVLIDLFNPDPDEIQAQVSLAGGWESYAGQVFYYSNQGEKVYPLPIYDSVLTDMNTEEGIANVSNRNARNNFLAAGMLVDKVTDNKTVAGETEEGRDNHYDTNSTEKALKEFQGDEKACKIMYVQIESDDEKPEFVSFKGTNYDKEFNVTLTSSQSNIGKSFNQPPILRAENVGANFGADLMKNAYNYYNSVIENERLVIERVFTTLFQNWSEPATNDYSIIPLSYEVEVSLADRLGKDNMTQLVSIMENAVLSIEQKRNMVKTLFSLSDDEINNLIPIPQPAP